MKRSKESLLDIAIINIIYSNLDRITQYKWKVYHSSADLPNLPRFLVFFKERQDVLQSQEEPYSSKHKNNNSYTSISVSNKFVLESNYL